MNKLSNTLKYYKYYFKYYGKYMFLHKPLCEKYKNDSFLIFNRIYFCRSCFYLFLGILISAVCAGFIKKLDPIYFLIYGFTIIILSFPRFYKKYSRFIRDIIRFNNGFMCGGLLIIAFSINIAVLFITLLFLLFLKIYYNKLRKNTDICQNCSELLLQKTCSGYELQKQALLDLEENYCRVIDIKGEFNYD